MSDQLDLIGILVTKLASESVENVNGIIAIGLSVCIGEEYLISWAYQK